MTLENHLFRFTCAQQNLIWHHYTADVNRDVVLLRKSEHFTNKRHSEFI